MWSRFFYFTGLRIFSEARGINLFYGPPGPGPRASAFILRPVHGPQLLFLRALEVRISTSVYVFAARPGVKNKSNLITNT